MINWCILFLNHPTTVKDLRMINRHRWFMMVGDGSWWYVMVGDDYANYAMYSWDMLGPWSCSFFWFKHLLMSPARESVTGKNIHHVSKGFVHMRWCFVCRLIIVGCLLGWFIDNLNGEPFKCHNGLVIYLKKTFLVIWCYQRSLDDAPCMWTKCVLGWSGPCKVISCLKLFPDQSSASLLDMIIMG